MSISATPTLTPRATAINCRASQCVGCTTTCYGDMTCPNSNCDVGYQYVFAAAIDYNCVGYGLCVNINNTNLVNASALAAYNQCFAVDEDGYCTACLDGSCSLDAKPTPTPTLSTGATPSSTRTMSPTPSWTPSTSHTASNTATPTPTSVCHANRCTGCHSSCDYDLSCSYQCDDGYTAVTTSAVFSTCYGAMAAHPTVLSDEVPHREPRQLHRLTSHTHP